VFAGPQGDEFMIEERLIDSGEPVGRSLDGSRDARTVALTLIRLAATMPAR